MSSEPGEEVILSWCTWARQAARRHGARRAAPGGRSVQERFGIDDPFGELRAINTLDGDAGMVIAEALGQK